MIFPHASPLGCLRGVLFPKRKPPGGGKMRPLVDKHAGYEAGIHSPRAFLTGQAALSSPAKPCTSSTSGVTRTPDRRIRNPMLYPPELRTHRDPRPHPRLAGEAFNVSKSYGVVSG